jgi:hypothetical protein
MLVTALRREIFRLAIDCQLCCRSTPPPSGDAPFTDAPSYPSALLVRACSTWTSRRRRPPSPFHFLTNRPVVGNFEYSLTTSARMAPEPGSVTSLREIGL